MEFWFAMLSNCKYLHFPKSVPEIPYLLGWAPCFFKFSGHKCRAFFWAALINFFVPGAVLIGVNTVTFYGTTFCLFFLEFGCQSEKMNRTIIGTLDHHTNTPRLPWEQHFYFYTSNNYENRPIVNLAHNKSRLTIFYTPS